MALDPTLALPEAFMERELDIVEGDVLTLLQTVFHNMGPLGIDDAWSKAVEAVRLAVRRLQQVNTHGASPQRTSRITTTSPASSTGSSSTTTCSIPAPISSART